VRYAQGTTLYTVEGNVSNKVTFRTISNYKSYSSLDGFGHLDLGCTCSTDTDCDDQDPCTTDTCVSGACTNAPVAGCCTKDAQCDDQDPCTQDTCDANTCKHAQVQGCCTKDAECDDQDPCTTDTCDANKCQHAQVQGCCTTDAQCDDGDADTYDRCVGNKCQSSTVPPDLGPDLGAADLGPGGTTDAGLVIPREAGPDPGLRQSSDEVLMGGCSTTGAGDRAPVGLVAMILVVLLGALTRRRDDA